MGILGIENRTENWKTARDFAPFLGDEDAAAAARATLAQRLGEPEETSGEDIRIELFWYGIRDYVYQTDENSRPGPKAAAKSFNNLFRDLRKSVQSYGSAMSPYGFKPLRPHNYDASDENWKSLFNNLINTEIDIVLETPDHLYIGEAKDESPPGAKSKYVLVHQLIRQYVMAKVLLDLKSESKEVIPFIVWDSDKREDIVQVRFMYDQEWLKRGNILTWDCIRGLCPPRDG